MKVCQIHGQDQIEWADAVLLNMARIEGNSWIYIYDLKWVLWTENGFFLKVVQLNWRTSVLVRVPGLRDFRSSRQCCIDSQIVTDVSKGRVATIFRLLWL
jgi:hypothetical protein